MCVGLYDVIEMVIWHLFFQDFEILFIKVQYNNFTKINDNSIVFVSLTRKQR